MKLQVLKDEDNNKHDDIRNNIKAGSRKTETNAEYDPDAIVLEQTTEYDDRELDDLEEGQSKKSFFSKFIPSFNVSPEKGNRIKGGIILALIVTVALVAFLNPFKDKATDTATDGVSTEQGPNDAPPAVLPTPEEIEQTLKQTYQGYEVKRDDATQSFIVTQAQDGSVHKVIVSFEGNTVSDELLDGTTGAQATPPPTDSAGSTSADGKTVAVNKQEFDESILALPVQNLNQSGGDFEVTPVKYIVAYKKLPLHGKIPFIYTQVIDSGEKIIFPIKFEEYQKIADKGTTIVEANLIKNQGVQIYEEVRLVEWRE